MLLQERCRVSTIGLSINPPCTPPQKRIQRGCPHSSRPFASRTQPSIWAPPVPHQLTEAACPLASTLLAMFVGLIISRAQRQVEGYYGRCETLSISNCQMRYLLRLPCDRCPCFGSHNVGANIESPRSVSFSIQPNPIRVS